MKKLTIMSVIFILFITGCLLYIGYSIKGQNKPYTVYENDLVDIAKAYVMSNKISVDVGRQFELTIDKMLEDKMLISNKVNDDECSGKVIIKKTMKGYEYKAKIKCSKYETLKK
ncbi:MAG: hypothetical protein K5666_03560 [Bacilli bacterium]|nr:hypothetical protein [Bacilli bacterium]